MSERAEPVLVMINGEVMRVAFERLQDLVWLFDPFQGWKGGRVLLD